MEIAALSVTSARLFASKAIATSSSDEVLAAFQISDRERAFR